MKTLVIGIFIIIVVALILFTVQIVKSPDFFKASVTPAATDMPAESNVFVDIKNAFTFSYPKYLSLADTTQFTGYAPVLQSENKYIAVGTQKLQTLRSTDIEIETYSEKLPIQTILEKIAGTAVTVEIVKSTKLTFKNSIPGFILEYKAVAQNNTESVEQSAVQIDGRIYFYRSGDKITYAFSAIKNGATQDKFIQDADKGLLNMAINY